MIRRLAGVGRPFGQQPAGWEAAIGLAGDVAAGGRTRIARKWQVMAASGLPRVVRVPCRQATGRIWPAAAMASWRRFTGGCG